jgi:trimethylamine-N-oxide reductase (cytochrome c) cytochrome c-type subunit TorY
MVPNSRCFKCKNVENHRQIDQARIHSKLIKGIANQPCKDCHSHEMRNGQKFFEKVTETETDAAVSVKG